MRFGAALSVFASFILVAACGAAKHAKSPDEPEIEDEPAPESPVDAGQASADQVVERPTSGIVRGRWTVDIDASDDSALALAKSGKQTITARVAATVTFTMDNSNFSTPTSTTGLASYGSLDITELTDNHLRVCGPDAHQLCAAGVIRVYTIGTPGKGLWSAIENLGLPIVTGSSEVGLDAGGAAVVKSVPMPADGVLELADFTSESRLAIPIVVDFRNAPYGSFKTTLVVEYVLL